MCYLSGDAEEGCSELLILLFQRKWSSLFRRADQRKLGQKVESRGKNWKAKQLSSKQEEAQNVKCELTTKNLLEAYPLYPITNCYHVV